MALRKLALNASIILAGTGAHAGDWAEQLSRTVELPAHRWLSETRTADGVALNAFTTDGCSGGMSSLWTFVAERYPAFAEAHGGVPPWEECCVTHDRAYHDAGPDPDPDASYDARLAADTVLRECVRETSSVRDRVLIVEYELTPEQVRAAYGAIAEGMFQAVRLGGGPCSGLPWRWGYGYPQCWKDPEE